MLLLSDKIKVYSRHQSSWDTLFSGYKKMRANVHPHPRIRPLSCSSCSFIRHEGRRRDREQHDGGDDGGDDEIDGDRVNGT